MAAKFPVSGVKWRYDITDVRKVITAMLRNRQTDGHRDQGRTDGLDRILPHCENDRIATISITLNAQIMTVNDKE